ncbi:MAG: hypothetical protein K2N72_02045 [Oscillospiraceae bacterium]|nr:hypothetical protein [Oscillospiraceae bacterium]
MTQDSSIKTNEAKNNAKKSAGNFFSKAMIHNGIMGFKHNFKQAVVLFVLHMAAAPLTISMLMASILTKGEEDVEGYMAIAVLTTGAAALAGILCALSAMPYLYKKSVVDMRLSLPMTTLQRFVSDFVSGLCVYVLPFMAASVFSLLLTLVGHIACDGKTFYRGYGSNPGWECHIFEEYAPLLIKGIIGGILLMIMFYTLTLLISCCCGSVFECVCYTLLANGLIPGSIAMAVYALLNDVYGLVPESYLAMTIPYTSPIGGCIGLVFALQSGFEAAVSNAGVPTSITYGKWLLIFGLVTVIYIICTYLIYRKRNAEDTGNPIVYSALFHVIMTLGTACIVYAFMVENEYIAPMIIITAIIYFVFSVIRRRGFKKFWRSAVSYICTMLVCLGSYAVVVGTGAFGAGSYVPNASAVSAVYLDYAGTYASSLDVEFSGFDMSFDNVPLKITDRDALEIITDVHRMTVNRNGKRDRTSKNFEIMYRLKSGRLVVREYSLTDEAILKLSEIDMMRETKEFRAYLVKAAADNLYYLPASLDVINDSENSITLAPQWRIFDDSGSRVHEVSSIRINLLPSDFKQRLGESLYADIIDETEADYFSDPHGIMQLTYGTDNGRTYYNRRTIYIRSYYTRTLEYLRGCGFKTELQYSKTFGLAAADNANITMVSDMIVENMTGKEVTSFTPLSSTAGSFYADGFANSFDLYEYTRLCEKYGLTEDLYTVLANSYKRYKTDESCYTIIVNGNAAVIDPRYNEAAERLFIVMTVQQFIDNMTNNETWPNYGTADNRTSRYKAFLSSFLTCYGREKIDSVAAPGVSVYDLIFSYANGNEKKGLGIYTSRGILADKYTSGSNGYSYDYSDTKSYGYGYWEDYPIDEEFNYPNSFGYMQISIP